MLLSGRLVVPAISVPFSRKTVIKERITTMLHSSPVIFSCYPGHAFLPRDVSPNFSQACVPNFNSILQLAMMMQCDGRQTFSTMFLTPSVNLTNLGNQPFLFWTRTILSNVFLSRLYTCACGVVPLKCVRVFFPNLA